VYEKRGGKYPHMCGKENHKDTKITKNRLKTFVIFVSLWFFLSFNLHSFLLMHREWTESDLTGEHTAIRIDVGDKNEIYQIL
jgi:hypothetical protein